MSDKWADLRIDLPNGYHARNVRARALLAERDALAERNAKLVVALIAAVRAAKLALFVIRKEDVMPNSSWQAGFDRDLKVAEDALAALQSEGSDKG